MLGGFKPRTFGLSGHAEPLMAISAWFSPSNMYRKKDKQTAAALRKLFPYFLVRYF